MKPFKTYQKILVCLLPFICAAAAYTAAFLLEFIPLPECTFHRLTGFYCPGCGGTRAILALLKGDILLSLRENAVVLLLAVTLLLLYIELLFRAFGKKLRSPARNNYYLFISLGLFLAYAVVRNFVPQIAPL